MRKRTGRPTILTDKMLDAADGYLEWLKTQSVVNDKGREVPECPTLAGLALYLGVNRTTLYVWEKQSRPFFDILETIRQSAERHLFKYGLVGQYNPLMAKFMLSAEHGKAEKTEVKHSGSVNLTSLTDAELAAIGNNASDGDGGAGKA